MAAADNDNLPLIAQVFLDALMKLPPPTPYDIAAWKQYKRRHKIFGKPKVTWKNEKEPTEGA